MPAISQIAIKKHMEKRGISIELMAQKTGAKPSHIRKIVDGKQDVVNPQLILKIAKVLGIPAASIRVVHSKRTMDRLFGDDDLTF